MRTRMMHYDYYETTNMTSAPGTPSRLALYAKLRGGGSSEVYVRGSWFCELGGEGVGCMCVCECEMGFRGFVPSSHHVFMPLHPTPTPPSLDADTTTLS